MTPPADPYRTLGLTRGATLADVKQAYRALAKINHPDAAGPAALPRFLAIQAAYEQLIAGSGAKAGGTRGAPRPPARPSDADPDRADATHRAYGGRSRRTRPGGPGAADPAGERTGTSGASGSGGAGTGGRPGGPRSRTAGADRGPGAGPDRGSPTGGDPAEDRDAPNKATLGSTSYDGADGQPFEPDWGGASWYGTTSGTYWTINPKEYADPRKHGPEYQARARRTARTRARAGELGTDGSPAADPAEPATSGADPSTAAGGSAPRGPTGPTHTTSSWWDSTAGTTGTERVSERERERTDRERAAYERAAYERAARERTARDRATESPTGRAGSTPDDIPPPDLAAAATDLGRALTDERTARGRWRFVQALVGWLPILFGLGWLIGEVTGCGRFAASCDGGEGLIAPVVGLLVLGVLLLVPVLAALAAAAAIALVVAAVPTALALSAGGEAIEVGSRAATLGIVLVVAWIVGLSFAVIRRGRAGTRPSA
jgi:curved DNA-binding protein CbpA